jgi:hypothetical protein
MDEDAVRDRLAIIIEEHGDLDAAIEAVQQSAAYDILRVQRLKKRKLALKDEIKKLQGLLLPDIIA